MEIQKGWLESKVKRKGELKMVANYYGGWSHDDDIALVEVILRNVRNGKGVIDGCKEYEAITNGRRSASANKYRFHTQLKEKYQKAYEMARMEGKKVKASKSKQLTKKERLEKVVDDLSNDDVKELTIEDVLVVVNQYKKQQQNKKVNESEMVAIRKENEELKKRNERLVKEVKELEDIIEGNINQQKQIVSALKILESAGINLNVPDVKYAVDKNGLVEKL